MSTQTHIMAVGAHIHDAEVMAGAILARFAAAGHRATVVHATPGDKGNPALPPAEYEKVKLEEARLSAERLGAGMIVLPYKDAELPLSSGSRRVMARLLRTERPDIVLTHWRGSFHPDHYNTHCLVMDALGIAADPAVEIDGLDAHVTRQVFFPENWEDMTGFVPDLYFDISEVYDVWHDAMMLQGLFRGEVSRFPYREYYEGLSLMRGARVGKARAVALMRPPLGTGGEELAEPERMGD